MPRRVKMTPPNTFFLLYSFLASILLSAFRYTQGYLLLQDPENGNYPLECLWCHEYIMRYAFLHMYFRLLAAIFDSPVSLTSESIHVSLTVLLDLKKMVLPVGNLLISRSNHDIPFTSGLRAAILNFYGRGLEYCETWVVTKIVLVLPYRSVKTAWTNSYPFRRFRRSFWPLSPLGNGRYGNSLGSDGLKCSASIIR